MCVQACHLFDSIRAIGIEYDQNLVARARDAVEAAGKAAQVLIVSMSP